jgi:hypothetical protein
MGAVEKEQVGSQSRKDGVLSITFAETSMMCAWAGCASRSENVRGGEWAVTRLPFCRSYNTFIRHGALLELASDRNTGRLDATSESAGASSADRYAPGIPVLNPSHRSMSRAGWRFCHPPISAGNITHPICEPKANQRVSCFAQRNSFKLGTLPGERASLTFRWTLSLHRNESSSG